VGPATHGWVWRGWAALPTACGLLGCWWGGLSGRGCGGAGLTKERVESWDHPLTGGWGGFGVGVGWRLVTPLPASDGAGCGTSHSRAGGLGRGLPLAGCRGLLGCC
jgi:hypothetical protein